MTLNRLLCGDIFASPRTRIGCVWRRGFTLVEMAISLVVISLMTSFGLQLAQASQNSQCDAITTQALAQIQAGIERYTRSNGRYPLPASRMLGSNDGAFGYEVGSVSDAGIRRVVQASPVLIGALPHATLGLASTHAGDCWGRIYTYAVSEAFTTASGFADGALVGGIRLNSGTLGAPRPLATQVAYVVISHGRDPLRTNMVRAVGGPMLTCDSAQADGSVTRIDKENCDAVNSLFYVSSSNNAAGDRFFDDQLVFAGRPMTKDCAAAPVTWGTHCSGYAVLTLGGLSVNVTNTAAGYTGLALSTCTAGVRSTLGVCLPIGACVVPSPRDGTPTPMLTGTTIAYGTGVCKTYTCCSGGVSISSLSPCLVPLDIPGLAFSCP